MERHQQLESVVTAVRTNSAGDASCLDQSFLHPNGAHNPRILQLGMKFIF